MRSREQLTGTALRRLDYACPVSMFGTKLLAKVYKNFRKPLLKVFLFCSPNPHEELDDLIPEENEYYD